MRSTSSDVPIAAASLVTYLLEKSQNVGGRPRPRLLHINRTVRETLAFRHQAGTTQSQCTGPPSRYRPCLGGHLRLLDQVPEVVSGEAQLLAHRALGDPERPGRLLRCEPNDETQRGTGSPPPGHAAQRGFKGKIGHGLGCGVMTGSLLGLQWVLVLPMASRETERRSVDVPGRVGPEAHSSPVPERTGESLLRHVLSGGPVQATDLERPHETRIVRFVNGDKVPGYIAPAVVFDDDSLSHRDGSRSPIALTADGFGGRGWCPGAGRTRRA